MNNLVEGLNISLIGLITTFSALVLIQFVIRMLARLCRGESSALHATKQPTVTTSSDIPAEEIAAIIAVLNLLGVNPGARIVIKSR